MRVFVAGATGVIGQPLVRQLVERGHEVVALARTDAAERALADRGATPARGSLFDAGELARAAEGCDVVVRAATRIPTVARPRASHWGENDKVRREGTRALLDAALAVGARQFVQESVVWLAQPHDGAPFDERSLPRAGAITQSALDAEQLAVEAAARGGLRAATLRLGWLYGPRAAHTQAAARALGKRRLPLIGNGGTRMSFLHAEDAARAFVATVEARAAGLWHVVDDAPATRRAFFTTLARLVGAPSPLRIPEFAARWITGEEAVRFMTTDMVTSNARFRKDVGWSPRFPTFEEGLADVARSWAVAGTRE